MDEEKEALISSSSFSQSYDQKSDASSSKFDKSKEKQKRIGFFGLFRYASTLDKFLMICGTFFSIVHGAGWPILAIIFGQMTNTFLRAENSNFQSDEPMSYTNVTTENSAIPKITKEEFLAAVVQFATYYALVGVAMFIASYAQVACWSAACTNQMHTLRKVFFKAILRQEIAWYDKNQSGEMTARLNDDLERIKEGIGDKFSMFLQYAAAFVSGFAIGFIFSWKLTLVMMSLTPLLALSGAFIAKIISTSTRREQEKYAKAAAVAEEVISCIRTVLSFNGQTREVERYKHALQEGKALGLRKYAFMGAGLFCTFLVMYSTYALAFWYGSVLILNDPEFPRGVVFTVFFAVMLGSSSLGQAAPHLSSLAISKGAAEKIFDIIDTEPKIDPYSYAGQRPQHVDGKIELHKVRFAYPTRKNLKILNGISLRVEPAQRVALVGASGCGKSTVVNLLLRYYDPTRGKITIDGYEISQLNLHWLRNMIGVVSQEPILFDGTIEENIRLGSQDVTKEAIIEAAKMANAYTFIEQLPDKFDTRTGERGVQLSGGQKQRIAIARALVRNPKILLLDEATSALDAESEEVVQLALNKAQEGRTTIAIAHRLSTIKDYDWIYVFEGGFIVEQGKHSELMDKKGLYYKMVLNQQLDEPDSDVATDSEARMSVNSSDQVAHSMSEIRLDSETNRRKKSSVVRKKISRQESIRRSTIVSQTSSVPISDTTEIHRLTKEIDEEKLDKAKWVKIIRENKKQWIWLILGFLGATISGTIMPCFALFYSQIFGVYSESGDALRSGGIFWSLMFLVLGFAQGIAFYMSCYSFGQTGENLTMGLRLKVFTNLLRQDVTYFDDEKHSTGKICTRLATDAPNVKAAVGFRIASIFSSTMAMVAAIIIAFVFGWKLALVVMTMVPLLIASGFLSFKVHVSNQTRDIQLMEAAGKIASESIGNIRTVQALCREMYFYNAYCQQLEKPYKENLKQDQIRALGFAFSQSVIFFMYAASFRFGGNLVADGEMAPLNVYRVFFAIAFCGLSFGESSNFIPDYVKARMSAALLFHMIGLEPRIDSCSKTGLKPEFRGTITFKNVYFNYPTRANVPVLQGLSFSIRPGKTLALVGPSGCGKSTVVSLLQRFYDPLHGHVTIDGYDLRSLNLPHYRKHVATVSQEPILFDCSIRDNIVYGLESSVTHEQIVQAAKLANIHEFILSLPQGYNTLVGEKGTQLSGGQKQRVAIARALVREPKILLLDEATSALDTESEKVVQEALDRAREGRTCIMIAHRLSTVQNSDYIAVVKEGRIVEKGTHTDLLNLMGTYYKMTQMQNLIDN